MEEELRAAPSSHRNAMSTKLRLYRRDLGKLQRDMKNSAPGFGSSNQPVGGSHQGVYSSQNQQSVSVQLWTLMCYKCCLSVVSSHFERSKQNQDLYRPVCLLAVLMLYERLNYVKMLRSHQCDNKQRHFQCSYKEILKLEMF